MPKADNSDMENQQKLSNPRFSELTERRVLLAIIFILVLSNVLTVANNSFQKSLYGLLSYIPVESLLKNSLINNQKLLELEKQNLQKQVHHMNARWESHRSRAMGISKNITKRLKANTQRNVSSIFGEAIPYLGTALVVSVTVADVKDACDTIGEMSELAQSLDFETDSEDQRTVCGTEIPNVDEVLVSVKQHLEISVNQAEEQAKESAINLYDAIGGTLYELLNK